MNNKKEPYLVYLICPYLKQLPSIRSPVVFGTRTQPLCLTWDTLGDSKTMSQSITRRQAQLPRQERRLWASLCHSAGFLKTGQEFVNSSGSGTTGKRGTHGSLTSRWQGEDCPLCTWGFGIEGLSCVWLPTSKLEERSLG